MAALRNLLKDIEALRQILQHLTTVAASEILGLYQQIDAQDVSKQILADTLSESFPVLLERFILGAADTTAVWYEDLAPDLPYRALVPALDFSKNLEKASRWAVFAPGEATVPDRLTGVAQKAIFDGSRKTVIANAKQERVRYARHAQADACEFCKVLSLRGAVYHSEEAASRGHTVDDSHDHCFCTVVAVRQGTKLFKPAYMKDVQSQYDAAAAALGPAKNYPGKNSYLKAVLAKMREQAKPGLDVEVAA